MRVTILVITGVILLFLFFELVLENRWVEKWRIQRAISRGEELPYSYFVSISEEGVTGVDSRAFFHSPEGRAQMQKWKKFLENNREKMGLRPSQTLGGVELDNSE